MKQIHPMSEKIAEDRVEGEPNVTSEQKKEYTKNQHSHSGR